MDDFWKCQNLYEEKEEHEWANNYWQKKKKYSPSDKRPCTSKVSDPEYFIGEFTKNLSSRISLYYTDCSRN